MMDRFEHEYEYHFIEYGASLGGIGGVRQVVSS